ncbi:MAG: hypothetical protein RL693_82 [Verrucomicrobiota bacterium]|jgi:hypothetical protein
MDYSEDYVVQSPDKRKVWGIIALILLVLAIVGGGLYARSQNATQVNKPAAAVTKVTPKQLTLDEQLIAAGYTKTICKDGKVCWCKPAAKPAVLPIKEVPAPKPALPVKPKVKKVVVVKKHHVTVVRKITPPAPVPAPIPTPVADVFVPPVVETPFVLTPVIPTPPSPLPPVVPTREANGFCRNLRLNAVVGAELELNSAFTRAGYGAWGLYCMRKLHDGQIGFGIGGQGAVYAGDPGNGHFGGHIVGVGPSMMRVWNRGEDLEAKLMLGDYTTGYREGDYRSREHRTFIGLSIAHNDYRRRLNGETSMPERQIFGMVGLPIGGHSGEYWKGERIGDGSKLGLYYNAGVRQYVNQNVYVQAGILGEIRSGGDLFSCSLRAGVTNKRRTLGAHAGIDACNGGIVPAVGIWYDLGTDLRLKRTARRQAAIQIDNGGGEPTAEVQMIPLASTTDAAVQAAASTTITTTTTIDQAVTAETSAETSADVVAAPLADVVN